MEKIKILWIDDDINRMALKPYIDEFYDNGIKIIPAESPDESDKILSEQKDFQCIIIDLSMALGENINCGEAKSGMMTGLIVLKKLIANTELDKIKKIVFTIVPDTAEVQGYCNANNVYYLRKRDHMTDTFVEEIKKIISTETIKK